MSSTSAIRAGKAFIEIGSDDSTLVRGLKNAERKLQAFGKQIEDIGKKLMKIGSAIAAPLVASSVAFEEMGTSLLKMSQRTGVSVETLSQFKHAAAEGGSSLEAFELSIKRMQKVMVAAAGGNKTAVASLEKIGLTVKDLDGLNPAEKFKLIADNISKLGSPTERAAAAIGIFGKNGTALLPIMLNGAKGINALLKEADELGLTMSTADAEAAETFHHALNSLWETLKTITFQVGAALAPLLQHFAELSTRVATAVIVWVKQNRDLIVTVFEIAAAVVAAGAGLVAMGYAFSMLATAVGGFVSMLTGAGAVLAAILSPLGIVTAGIVALGAYLVYASNVGGVALNWLAQRFGDLRDFAVQAFKGISDAMMAGDMALAGKILWLELKIAWQTGIVALKTLWADFSSGVLEVFETIRSKGLQAWESLTYGLTFAWIQAISLIKKVWAEFDSWYQNKVEALRNFLAKRWVEIQATFDPSIDVAGQQEYIDNQSSQKIGEISKQKTEALDAMKAERDSQLAGNDSAYDARMKQISDEYDAQIAKIEEGKAGQTVDTSELQRLKNEFNALTKKAADERTGVKSPERLKMLDQPDFLSAGIAGAGGKFDSAGTFNAMKVAGLGAGGLASQIADATQETAENTKKIADNLDLNGGDGEFE